MALLTYDEMVVISYVTGDVAVLLTPEQQSLAIQAVALFTMPSLWSDWDENKALIDELVPATLLALETPVTIPPNVSPKEACIWHINSQNNVGNGLLLQISTTQIMNHIAFQFPAAITDIFHSNPFWLKGGVSYVVEIYTQKNAAGGQATLRLRKKSDDTVLDSANIDLYSAAAVANFVVQLGEVLSDDTEVYITGDVTGKAAASSSYRIPITCFMVRS